MGMIKNTLIMSLNGSESSVLNSSKIFVGMLLGPIDSMSAGVVGERKIVSSVVCPRNAKMVF